MNMMRVEDADMRQVLREVANNDLHRREITEGDLTTYLENEEEFENPLPLCLLAFLFTRAINPNVLITQLYFAENNFMTVALQHLMQALTSINRIKVLSFNACTFTLPSFEILGKYLQNTTALKSFELSATLHQGPLNRGLIVLLPYLAKNKSILNLNLSYNAFGASTLPFWTVFFNTNADVLYLKVSSFMLEEEVCAEILDRYLNGNSAIIDFEFFPQQPPYTMMLKRQHMWLRFYADFPQIIDSVYPFHGSFIEMENTDLRQIYIAVFICNNGFGMLQLPNQVLSYIFSFFQRRHISSFYTNRGCSAATPKMIDMTLPTAWSDDGVRVVAANIDTYISPMEPLIQLPNLDDPFLLESDSEDDD